jgi:magnesium transporter
MASARTTYQDRQGGDGAAAADPFVWVSLRDPSPEELAAVQREFGLPAPLMDGLATAAPRPVLELTGQLLFAVVKTTTWVAAEEVVRLGEVQLVLGDGFVVSVDRDGAVLEHVRQDLEDDPELAGAGLAAVLPCLVDHAAEGYGPVLGALNNAVEEVEEAVFSPARARPTERIYQLSRQLLEFRRAVAPLTEMLDRLAAGSTTAAGERLKQRYRERRAHLGSRRGSRSGPSPPCSPASTG